MPESEGDILKEYLKTEKMSYAALGAELDMTGQGISYQIKQKEIDIGFKYKMSAVGRDIFKVGIKELPGSKNKGTLYLNAADAKDEIIIQLKARVKTLEEMVALMKSKAEADKALYELTLKQHKNVNT